MIPFYYPPLIFNAEPAEIIPVGPLLHYPFINLQYQIFGVESNYPVTWEISKGQAYDGLGDPLVTIEDPNVLEPVLNFESTYQAPARENLTLKVISQFDPEVFAFIEIITTLQENPNFNSRGELNYFIPKYVSLKVDDSPRNNFTGAYYLISPIDILIEENFPSYNFAIDHKITLDGNDFLTTSNNSFSGNLGTYEIYSLYRYPYKRTFQDSLTIGSSFGPLLDEGVSINSQGDTNYLSSSSYFTFLSLSNQTFNEVPTAFNSQGDTNYLSSNSYFTFVSLSNQTFDEIPTVFNSSGQSAYLSTSSYFINSGGQAI